jgi:glycosyltransferase involved in cell wall biosynthesis
VTGIHQLLVSASPGDAVTDTTFAARQVLQQVGPSHIGAKYWDPVLDGQLLSFDQLTEQASPGDALLYHASIGEPGIVDYVQRWDGPVILQYHNMTPAAFFQGVDQTLAVRLTEGRLELAQLVGRADAAIADSHFNASELIELGYEDVRVVPLLMDVQGLLDAEPTASTMHHFAYNEGPVLFFLGQLLPHKRPDLLIRAYHLLVTFHRPDAHLVIAGPPRIPAFAEHLTRMCFELGLPRCWITGRVPRADLVAFYRSATAFVTASEHEGVCLPLIEAMGFGVPIIARACTAVPETLGGAGVLLPDDDDPGLLCEAMLEMIENEALRATCIAAGTARLAELRPEAAGDGLLAALADAL